MRRAVAMALALSLPAGSALAEGWSFVDLGEYSTRDECMDRARSAISSYKFEHGGGNTAAESWTVYGYDLEPGDNDAVILCPWVNGDVVNAFLTVHGETSEDDRTGVANEIENIWKSQ